MKPTQLAMTAALALTSTLAARAAQTELKKPASYILDWDADVVGGNCVFQRAKEAGATNPFYLVAVILNPSNVNVPKPNMPLRNGDVSFNIGDPESRKPNATTEYIMRDGRFYTPRGQPATGIDPALREMMERSSPALTETCALLTAPTRNEPRKRHPGSNGQTAAI